MKDRRQRNDSRVRGMGLPAKDCWWYILVRIVIVRQSHELNFCHSCHYRGRIMAFGIEGGGMNLEDYVEE